MIPPQYHLPELRGRPQYDSPYLPRLNSPAEFNGARGAPRCGIFDPEKRDLRFATTRGINLLLKRYFERNS